jgi:hypothetical protein
VDTDSLEPPGRLPVQVGWEGIDKMRKREVILAEYARIFKKLGNEPHLSRSAASAIATGEAVSEIDLRELMEQPRNAANIRHEKELAVKTFVINRYRSGQWKSKRNAAKQLTPDAASFASGVGANILKTDGAVDTVYRWILQSSKT